MSNGSQNEKAAVLAQVDALQQQNSQLKQQLAAVGAQLQAERQQFQFQLQAAMSGAAPPVARANPVVFLTVGVVAMLLLAGVAGFFLVSRAPPPPPPYEHPVG